MRICKSLFFTVSLSLCMIVIIAACGSSPDQAPADQDPVDNGGDEAPDGDPDKDEDEAEQLETDGDLDDDLEDEIDQSCERRCITVSGDLDNLGNLNYGAVTPGNCSTLDVVISSSGIQPVTIIDVRISTDSSQEFEIVQFSPEEPTLDLQPMHVLTVSVRYCPVDLQEDGGMLVIASNDDISPRYEVPMTMEYKGNVEMTVSPPSIDFEEVELDSLIRKFIYIEATPNPSDSNRPLQIDTMTLIDAENLHYSLPEVDNPCSGVIYIEAGDHVNCPVDFRPTEDGTWTETVTIEGTDGKEADFNEQVELVGAGISAGIELVPDKIEYGYVLIDRPPVVTTISINNPGTGDLTILNTSWILNDGGAFSSASDPTGSTIEPGYNLEFDVIYDPTTEGINVGTLDIVSSATTDAPVQLITNAIAVEECPVGMSPDPDDPNNPICIVRCDPGEPVCVYEEEGWGTRTCEEDGETLGDFEPCPEAYHICYDGLCQEPPCLAGDNTCFVDEEGVSWERSCLADNSGWGPPIQCSAPSQCETKECTSPYGSRLCELQNSPAGSACDDGNECTEDDKCSGGICVPGHTLDCNDDNQCTSDDCNPNEGCVYRNLNGQECDDGNECTSGDRCVGDVCTPGTSAFDCNDHNPCTFDDCDPEGNPPCSHEPIEGECSDSDVCTVDDFCCPLDGSIPCVVGECVPGPPNDCEDGNDCTDDICSPQTGCRHNNRSGECSDGDPCTRGDHCGYDGFDYMCLPGVAVDCEDENPCTIDSCDEDGNCIYDYIEGAMAGCNDNDVCTENDHCCTSAENAEGSCDMGECVIAARSNCEDGNPCTTNSCHAVQGCQTINNNELCDDNNPCTIGDQCSGGSCVPGSTQLPCNDNNSCTSDVCNPLILEGDPCESTNLPDGSTCDDGDPCTTGDNCQAGVCVYTGGENCDDLNPCTVDGCDESGCTHEPQLGLPCEDGNPCTAGDYCSSSGSCISGSTPLVCPTEDDPVADKDLSCRSYYCKPYEGCAWNVVTGGCDDGDPCTLGDYCDAGFCVSGTTPNLCNDDNGCTDDTCVAGVGCSNVANNADCDDGDPCTVGDQCADKACQPGTGDLDCADTDPCTEDICQAGLGCKHNPISGVACDDGDPCTIGDECTGGVCRAGLEQRNCDDDNPCTDDGCSKVTGNPVTGCFNNFDATNFCTDNNLCTTDTCTSDGCSHAPVVCNDGNPCTTDTCPDVNGCVYTNNTDPCDDGKFCTINDTCGGGSCNGQTNTCEDVITEEQCQYPYCNENLNRCEAISDNEGESCDDDLYCNVGETCQSGACTGGSDRNCSSGNQCKIDSCDESGNTCVHENKPDGTSCNDGSSSTLEDHCESGTCTGNSTFQNYGACPGHSDMVKIVGTRSCIDKYEMTICFSNSCSSNCLGTSSDNYWSCFLDGGSDMTCSPKPRACVKSTSKPSRYMTWNQADKACARAGKKLCDPTDWVAACKMAEGGKYVYSDTYDSDACNTSEYGEGNTVTNSELNSTCTNDGGTFHMNGNLWEWVYEEGNSVFDSVARGGSYNENGNSFGSGGACEARWSTGDGTEQAKLGGRCCIEN